MLYGAGYIYIYVHVTRVQDGGRQEQLSNQKGEKKKRNTYNKASIFMHDWSRSIGRREPYTAFKPIETFGKGEPGYQSIRQL